MENWFECPKCGGVKKVSSDKPHICRRCGLRMNIILCKLRILKLDKENGKQ